MKSRVWRGKLAILAILAIAGTAGCAPALDWRDVRPAGSGATLLFPCRPSSQERQVALAGPAVALTLQACGAAGLTWGLAFADVSDPSRVGPALNALRTAAAANIGAADAPVSTWRVPGATPNDNSGLVRLSGRLPGGLPVQLQVLVFTRGTQVFQASVFGEPLPEEAAQTFFSSIRFER